MFLLLDLFVYLFQEVPVNHRLGPVGIQLEFFFYLLPGLLLDLKLLFMFLIDP
jgi:hypothetical protein